MKNLIRTISRLKRGIEQVFIMIQKTIEHKDKRVIIMEQDLKSRVDKSRWESDPETADLGR